MATCTSYLLSLALWAQISGSCWSPGIDWAAQVSVVHIKKRHTDHRDRG